MTAQEIKEQLFAMADEAKRDFLPYFFKTGEGQYGYGDKFIGVVVPKQRKLIKICKPLLLSLEEIEKLLEDEYHECRMTGLFFLIELYKKAGKDEARRREIYDFYIAHHNRVNNWDLVDNSAPYIVGDYLTDRDKSVLKTFAVGDNLWLQRIAIVSTLWFIRKGILKPTFEVSLLLLDHRHDLIHKAVGWMLREAGKKDFDAEYAFLTEGDRYRSMSRTMLRYAIEKFPETLRQQFLKGEV